jgi:aryl-alcohol dehydrogenase-like predicted oxidoreductase
MDYRELGRTGLRVSAICLGTMTYGEQNTEAEGHEQMDYAVDQGVNFFDAAELYPIPPKADTQGRTEDVIGAWFQARRNRDKIILATKVVGRTGMTWFRKDKSPGRLTRAQITEAVEGSLKRLRTDYIDLYQTHWPDRPMRIFGGLGYERFAGDEVAIEETLQALAGLVQQGKVRYAGVSNETPWGVMEYLNAAERHGLPRIVSIQNAYNLLSRAFETGLSEITEREQVGLLAYSPLGQGYLTGKYRNGALPAGSRKQLFDRLQRYETPQAGIAMEKYFELAGKAGISPTHLALQWVTTRWFVTANIIGATTMAQLKENLASVNTPLTGDVLQGIEDIHQLHSNPCP